MQCCGAERQTRYCPDCGRKLLDEPLIDLLAYCRKRQEKANRRYTRLETKMAHVSSAKKRTTIRRRLEKIQQRAAFWQRFIEALENTLNTSPGNGPSN